MLEQVDTAVDGLKAVALRVRNTGKEGDFTEGVEEIVVLVDRATPGTLIVGAGAVDPAAWDEDNSIWALVVQALRIDK